MSIKACSSDTSFKSASVASLLENVPPTASGCAVFISETPSPPGLVPAAQPEAKAVFRTSAPFTCFVFAIDLARAFV